MRVVNCQSLAGMMYHPNSITGDLHTTHNSLQLPLGLPPWDGSGNLMLCMSTVEPTLQHPNQHSNPYE